MPQSTSLRLAACAALAAITGALVAGALATAPGCAHRRQPAVAHESADALAWLRLGRRRAAAGDVTGAIVAFERAAGDPALAGWALVLAARAAAGAGDAVRARALLVRAQGRAHHLPLVTLRDDPALAPRLEGPGAASLRGYEFVELRLGAGRRFEQVVLTPRAFEANRPSPALVALPDDPADHRAVERGLLRLWGRQATERGWVVISPASRDVPASWLVEIATSLRVEPAGFWIAGVEAGAERALRLAAGRPELVAGVILVGDAPEAGAVRNAAGLRGVPALLFAGAEDPDLPRIERAAEALAAAGLDVRLERLPGEGDWPLALAGGRLIEAAAGGHGE